jgi:hypothetical protein
MSFGIRSLTRTAAIILGSALLAAAADKPQTFTGTVTDAMCGATHQMTGAPAECLKSCIKGGSAYALVVGDKVYKLEGKTDGLEAIGDGKATVTGTTKGNTIEVQAVAAAK